MTNAVLTRSDQPVAGPKANVIGGLSSLLAAGVPGEITTAPMAQLPLILIPAFLVPLFFMLHITALYQAGRRS